MTLSDLVSDPTAAVHELYDFIGQEPPPSVLAWARNPSKVDLLQGTEMYPEGRWNSTHERIVEEECKPLIIKMGLQFRQLDIQYSESYY